MLSHVLSNLTALARFFRFAHWKVKGNTSFQDHLLYERLYNETEDLIDGVAEKSVGLEGPDSIDSVQDSKAVTDLLTRWKALRAEETLPAVGLKAANEVLATITRMKQECEAEGKLTEGLDNQLQGICDVLESHTYLLQQRTAEEPHITAASEQPAHDVPPDHVIEELERLRKKQQQRREQRIQLPIPERFEEEPMHKEPTEERGVWHIELKGGSRLSTIRNMMVRLGASSVVSDAIDATPSDYFAKTLNTRNPGVGSQGSVFATAQTKESLRSADWAPYSHPAIKGPAKAYSADIPGFMGVVPLASLPGDTMVELSDAKGTGKLSALVRSGKRFPVDFTVLLVGPGDEGKDVVWTFFPGDPIAPSELSAGDVPEDKRYITAKEALALGLEYGKIEGGQQAQDSRLASSKTHKGEVTMSRYANLSKRAARKPMDPLKSIDEDMVSLLAGLKLFDKARAEKNERGADRAALILTDLIPELQGRIQDAVNPKLNRGLLSSKDVEDWGLRLQLLNEKLKDVRSYRAKRNEEEAMKARINELRREIETRKSVPATKPEEIDEAGPEDVEEVEPEHTIKPVEHTLQFHTNPSKGYAVEIDDVMFPIAKDDTDTLDTLRSAMIRNSGDRAGMLKFLINFALPLKLDVKAVGALKSMLHKALKEETVTASVDVAALLKLAYHLDEKQLYSEADQIEELVKTLATRVGLLQTDVLQAAQAMDDLGCVEAADVLDSMLKLD